jgi:hypothetical protein
MVILVSIYLIVGGILVLLIKIYPPATVFAPAAFLPLGLVVYTAWATHMELSAWRGAKADEAMDRKVRTGLKVEIKALTTERDTLTLERDTLSTQCHILQVQVDTLTHDCNTLSTTRTELLTEVDSLSHRLDTLLHHLDTPGDNLESALLPHPTPQRDSDNRNGITLQPDCTALQPNQARLTPAGLHLSRAGSTADPCDRVTDTPSTSRQPSGQAGDEREVTARETRLNTIVTMLHTDPDLTLSALADALSISRTTLYRDLTMLQARGLLDTTKVGVRQNGHSWTVVL